MRDNVATSGQGYDQIYNNIDNLRSLGLSIEQGLQLNITELEQWSLGKYFLVSLI